MGLATCEHAQQSLRDQTPLKGNDTVGKESMRHPGGLKPPKPFISLRPAPQKNHKVALTFVCDPKLHMMLQLCPACLLNNIRPGSNIFNFYTT
ncbi:hypothetical protein llap_7218 [Limosa lapponica baueri]|uniref:Uncharacterized protein n=1 Tax=Limosa lapponica baueri TaxID=1758121 RepID=A0A2I0U8S5_LIMLA|nr:hypothetical protein llap_7218 [Limosa lapponica baueri]